MEEMPLHIGTQIRLIQPYMGHPVGTRGIIVHLYGFDTNFCRVRFDSSANAYPIHCRNFVIADRVEWLVPASLGKQADLT